MKANDLKTIIKQLSEKLFFIIIIYSFLFTVVGY
uniref:Uncharacterized protein n=1 Tax=Anguilla anguilla TaxID=7936 RepID=A0A0E9QPR7_ANGAN